MKVARKPSEVSQEEWVKILEIIFPSRLSTRIESVKQKVKFEKPVYYVSLTQPDLVAVFTDTWEH